MDIREDKKRLKASLINSIYSQIQLWKYENRKIDYIILNTYSFYLLATDPLINYDTLFGIKFTVKDLDKNDVPQYWLAEEGRVRIIEDYE